MRKPRRLVPGDRISVVAPGSPFARADFEAGVAELRLLGFDPHFEQSVFERRGYVPQRRNTVALHDEWLANTTMDKRLAPKEGNP